MPPSNCQSSLCFHASMTVATPWNEIHWVMQNIKFKTMAWTIAWLGQFGGRSVNKTSQCVSLMLNYMFYNSKVEFCMNNNYFLCVWIAKCTENEKCNILAGSSKLKYLSYKYISLSKPMITNEVSNNFSKTVLNLR